MICADFESILVPEDNGKQNIKNVLLVVMNINKYVLMINLINPLSLTYSLGANMCIFDKQLHSFCRLFYS